MYTSSDGIIASFPVHCPMDGTSQKIPYVYAVKEEIVLANFCDHDYNPKFCCQCVQAVTSQIQTFYKEHPALIPPHG